jgi:hypothetical protein
MYPHVLNLSWLIVLSALLILRAGYVFARGARTGLDGVPVVKNLFGPAAEFATAAQLDRLRWLGADIPDRLSRHQARRLIAAIESRLPATPAQQLALVRYGSPRGVFTRASAERFLRDKAAEELFYRQHDWAAKWCAAGVEVRLPEMLDPGQMEAFDAAHGSLATRGLGFPLPAYIWSWHLGEHVARVRMAIRFMDDPGMLRARLVADGVLRRELDNAEIRQLFPAYASLVANVGERYLAAVETLFLAAIHAERPALLLDHAQGWMAAAEARREIEAEAELRAADAAIDWDEDEE